jgi:hypothetical protein
VKDLPGIVNILVVLTGKIHLLTRLFIFYLKNENDQFANGVINTGGK